ncbi:hypothetical protein DdX_10524 [Ditylenchus destructor]|uniref:Secreted protein n=1 Tax=Ditylenchus destructor TaxID=166010 RepID=A0AAD4MXY6_9BILA|nr:hypothetical protein DdX_10524 [Ditylenchus destructor]
MMFALQCITILAFIPFINGAITEDEKKAVVAIFKDLVNFSPAGKGTGVLQPLPDLVGEGKSERLAVFVGKVKGEIRGKLDKFCGKEFDDVKVQTFSVNPTAKGESEDKLKSSLARLYIALSLANLLKRIDETASRSHHGKSIESFVTKQEKKDGNGNFKKLWAEVKKTPLNLEQHLSVFDGEGKENVGPTEFRKIVCIIEYIESHPNKTTDPVLKIALETANKGVTLFYTLTQKVDDKPESAVESKVTSTSHVITFSVEGEGQQLVYSEESCPTPDQMYKVAQAIANKNENETRNPAPGGRPAKKVASRPTPVKRDPTKADARASRAVA